MYFLRELEKLSFVSEINPKSFWSRARLKTSYSRATSESNYMAAYGLLKLEHLWLKLPILFTYFRVVERKKIKNRPPSVIYGLIKY